MSSSLRSVGLRALIIAAVLALAGSCSNDRGATTGGAPPPPPPPPPLGAKKLTVIVAVVDSLMPGDLGPTTPTLNGLKADGTFYDESRSVFAAETIPNHVTMMTGVYPARNGIPANEFIDFSAATPDEVDLSIPEELTANTLFTWINKKCVANGFNPEIKTGATLSKKYLYEIFSGDAANPDRANDNPNVFNVQPDSYWNPQDDDLYIGSPDEHTPDLPTMTQARAQLPDVDFFFINLGDVDRSAHAGGQAFRAAILPQTDSHVGDLIADLETAGRWENTVLFVVSDHGMDFSPPGPLTAISVQSTLDDVAGCGFAPMQAVANGGTDGIFVLDRNLPLASRQAALRAARACVLDTPACSQLCAAAAPPGPTGGSIEFAWYTTDDPLDPEGNMPASLVSGHPNLGDLVLAAAEGSKFFDPQSDVGGFIPGNHGHVVTLHNTFLITGGSPWVKKDQVIASSAADPSPLDRLPEQSENVDLAPTIAWLLGLNIQPNEFPDGQGGFDGRILKEAFTQFDANPNAASPTVCGRFD